MFYWCTKFLNKDDDDVVISMRVIPSLSAIFAAAFLLLGALGFVPSASALASQDEITYETVGDVIVVHTPDATVGIWTVLPSAVIRSAGNETEPGYGFIFSSIFAYNESTDGGLALEDVMYHAPLEHTTWAVADIVESSDPEAGESLTVTMTATTNINKRLTMDDGNPDPGSPGVLVIENWANIVAKFVVTTGNYSSNYDVADAPDYLVNGSTEIKFDIEIDLLGTDIEVAADSAALDIGVMMMDGYEFGPTANDMPYVLQGYQDDGVSVSDPEVNETEPDGVTLLMHTFQHRSEFKQIFEFVEGSEALGYFSWARMAQLSWSGTEDALENISTFYRTDGAALRVYLTTPMNETTTRIVHDPSVGVFDLGGGGIIELPDESIIGRSAMSLAIGLVIGLAAAAGAGTYVVFTRDVDEDPVDLVVLEKNRYYRKR
jgi:hypothetical protein